jgi:hypothetical protein
VPPNNPQRITDVPDRDRDIRKIKEWVNILIVISILNTLCVLYDTDTVYHLNQFIHAL